VKAVEASQIKSNRDYALERDVRRKRMITIKESRRVAVGEHLTLLFENHDTVLYQIQEMLRVEQISDPQAIAHELATYNELVPGNDELKATLFIEYSDEAVRDRWLRRLLGLEKHLALDVAGVGRTPAVFDTRQMSDERISSVHYVCFALGDDAARAVRGGAAVAVVVDHPEMSLRADLNAEQLAALREDLEAD